MLSSIFNQQLSVPLSSDSVLEFLRQSNFWQNVWQASTITESGQFQIDLQTQLKLTLFSTSIQITQSLPHPAHPCQANVHWSDHHLTLNYHVSSTSPTATLLRFSAHLDKSNLIVQSQAKLILRHHWQSLVSALHEAQHEFVFQNLQSNNATHPEIDSLIKDDNQSDTIKQFKPNTQPTSSSSPTTNHQSTNPIQQESSHQRYYSSSSPLFFQPPLPTIPFPTHGFTLWRTANDWQKAVRPVFASEQLTASQWLVLYFLVELSNNYRSLTATQLANLTGLHKMIISDLVKQLVKKHYLRKLKLSHNKKEFQLQVTTAGKTTAFAVFGKLQQAEKEFFKQ